MHSPRYTTLSTGATDWRAERTDGWVRWMGDPLVARGLSSAPGTSARLGSHSGGGMIVQCGGAMSLSSSTATVSDAHFTSCSAAWVRDGLHHTTPHHTTPYPSIPRPLHPYPTPKASTPHHNTSDLHRTHRATPPSPLVQRIGAPNGRTSSHVGLPLPPAPRPVSARTLAAA